MSNFTPIESTKSKFTKRDLLIACGILGTFVYFVYRSRSSRKIRPETSEIIEDETIEEEDEEEEEDDVPLEMNEREHDGDISGANTSEEASRNLSGLRGKGNNAGLFVDPLRYAEKASAKTNEEYRMALENAQKKKKVKTNKNGANNNKDDEQDLKKLVGMFKKKTKQNDTVEEILYEDGTDDYGAQNPLETYPSTLP
jgi:hypothetical protein